MLVYIGRWTRWARSELRVSIILSSAAGARAPANYSNDDVELEFLTKPTPNSKSSPLKEKATEPATAEVSEMMISMDVRIA